MDKIKAIIVDDEEFSIIDLKDELISYPNVEIVATFSNGIDGVAGINELQPDLVFVDIEMPGLSGFQMLGKLHYSPLIIFCSGYGKYAVEGYDYNPTDFLLKPLKKQRFQAAMERAFKDLEVKELESRLNRQKSQAGYLFLEYRDLHGDSHKVFVWPGDIGYLCPQPNNANYLEYHMVDGTSHIVKKTLKKALSELPESQFLQTHRSYAVNVDHIRELKGNDTLIIGTGPEFETPVSRAYRKTVKEFLKSLY